MEGPVVDPDIDRLADLIREARSVVALTGAGISVPSGIPDFRSPGTGSWANVDPMEVAHIDVFRADPERFWSFYAERFATLALTQPNEAHHALTALQQQGLLDAVITQNIDMLHRKAGTRGLIEVHGSIEHCVCEDCDARVALVDVQTRVQQDPAGVPRCTECSTPLKPEVVLFGELLPERAMRQAHELCAEADVLLCIGTSLAVYPVAALPRLTAEGGGEVAIITEGPTPLDDLSSVRLNGDVVEELEELLAALAP